MLMFAWKRIALCCICIGVFVIHLCSYSVQCTATNTSNNRKHIIQDLLKTVAAQFGKKRMRYAMANDVFAHGLLNILHNIGHRKISAKVTKHIGDNNTRQLLLWKQLITYSEQQFERIKSDIQKAKNTETKLKESTKTRKSQQKEQMLQLMKGMLIDIDSDKKQTALFDNFLDVFEDKDKQNNNNNNNHDNDHQYVGIIDADLIPDSVSDAIDDDVYITEHLMIDNWLMTNAADSDADSDADFDSQRNCAFIDSGTQIYLSLNADDDCVVRTHSHKLSDYIQHIMRWDLQLVHEGNGHILQSLDNNNNNNGGGRRRRRRRRRRQLLSSNLLRNVCAQSQTQTQTQTQPICTATYIIESMKDAADTDSQRINIHINLSRLSISVTHSLHILDMIEIINIENAITAETLRLLADTNLRSIVIDFSSGKISVHVPNEHGREIVFDLYNIIIKSASMQKLRYFTSFLEMRCGIGSGAVLLTEEIFSHFRVDAQPFAHNVIIARHEWQDFIAGQLTFMNADDAIYGRHSLFLSSYSHSHSSASYHALATNHPYFVHFYNHKRVWFSLSKSRNWMVAGHTYKWRVGIFSLLNNPSHVDVDEGRTPIGIQMGFEIRHTNASNADTNVDRILFATDSQMRYVNGHAVDTNGHCSVHDCHLGIGVTATDLTLPLSDHSHTYIRRRRALQAMPSAYPTASPTASFIEQCNVSPPVGWFDGSSFDVSTLQWFDKSGSENHFNISAATMDIGVDLFWNSRMYVRGSHSTKFSFPIEIADAQTNYTVFNVARYAPGSLTAHRKRILASDSSVSAVNWASGFWNNRAGVAYHGGTQWLKEDGIDSAVAADRWVFSASQLNLYRRQSYDDSSGVLYEDDTNYASVDPLSNETPQWIGVNQYGTETSDFNLAEVIIFADTPQLLLTPTEIACVERYLVHKYTLGARRTLNPTPNPTTNAPTVHPTFDPSFDPTASPTHAPTTHPTFHPSVNPTGTPSHAPTNAPTLQPSAAPTGSPTTRPTHTPTASPSSSPTHSPTENPTADPTRHPTQSPSTENPSMRPTRAPSAMPSTHPTMRPSLTPTTATPTLSPTVLTEVVLLSYLSEQHSPEIKYVDLVLDISSRKTGKVSLIGEWGDDSDTADADAKEIELFELDLNCESYAFRPIITTSMSGIGVLLLSDSHGNGDNNNNERELVTMQQLVHAWSAHNTKDRITFDWPLNAVLDVFSSTVVPPQMQIAITMTLNSAQSLSFDTVFRNAYSIDDIHWQHSEDTNAHAFGLNLKKSVEFKIHARRQRSKVMCLVGFSDAHAFYPNHGHNEIEIMPVTDLSVQQQQQPVQEMAVTIVWSNNHITQVQPHQIIVEHESMQRRIIGLDLEQSMNANPSAFYFSFLCEAGTPQEHIFYTIQKTIHFGS